MPDRDPAAVELHAAFVWDCDACGAENFVRGITAELAPEDQESLADDYGGEPEDWRTGDWIAQPTEVQCRCCGVTFRTANPNEDDDEQ